MYLSIQNEQILPSRVDRISGMCLQDLETGKAKNMDSRLRVGLLLDSFSLPAWVFTALERMVRSNHAELALVVLDHSQTAFRSTYRERWLDASQWLYHGFNAIDRKLFVRGPDALAAVDATALLFDVPQITVELPFDDCREQHLRAEDVAAIRSYGLDLLVKIGAGKAYMDLLSAATYGVWAYRWGDSRKIENGLTGFWEVVRGDPETGAALQRLGENTEQNLTLFESWFSTYPFSPARNQNCILWAAASFLPRQIQCLHDLGGEKYFQGCKSHSHEELPALKSNGFPSGPMVLWIMIKLAYKNLDEIYRRNFQRERWELLFSLQPASVVNISELRKIPSPQDRFWADPHIVYEQPNYYIFVEEYLYQNRRGHISVIEMDQAGKYGPSMPVLQEDWHLSFPSVFAWMGRYYMIPESAEHRTIDLYECTEFPYQWKKKLTLMKGVKAVDTTVVFFQKKWWLFTAMAEQEAAAPQVELFLFSSKELFTDHWTPHPMNPIVSDVKRARGAGRIFQKDGMLMRPSQDCSVMYGHGFDLNEVITLSETEYCERPVASVRPKQTEPFIATHTYASLGNLTVIDALTRPPKWAR